MSNGIQNPAPRAHSGGRSLEGLHGTVRVPGLAARPWRQYLAFFGPALLVSIGYMEPGNWATDLQAGAQFKYQLLWIVGLSSLMAIFLQIISARLGLATGQDLAQCCRDFLPAWTRWPNYLSCEIAIMACDLAEILGSAVAIHLLFPRISLLVAVCITGLDVLLLLALQRFGMRLIEAVALVLIATIAGCYLIEIFVLAPTAPGLVEMGRGLLEPDFKTFFHSKDLLFVAIGIIGATVMPHNLYLHSALVQTRQLRKDEPAIRQAIRYNTLDTTVALTIAFFVNAAILVLAAMVFFGQDKVALDSGHIVTFNADSDWIQVAYLTLAPLLGTVVASLLFAVALLASGQASTLTGTLAGQVVMEGFMHWKIRPWVRRLITRLCAIVPTIIFIAIRGDQSVNDLLTLSQVVLAMQLPLAMLPLMCFACSKRRMGAQRIGPFLMAVGWAACLLITALDIYELPGALHDAWAILGGR